MCELLADIDPIFGTEMILLYTNVVADTRYIYIYIYLVHE